MKERGLFPPVDHYRLQFSEQTHFSVVLLLLLLLFSNSTSDFLSFFLIGGCHVTQSVPVFISMIIDQCLCDHDAFIAAFRAVDA